MNTADIFHPLLSDVLSGLPSEDGNRLTEILRSRDVNVGETLFLEGDPATEMFFILSGAVAVHKKSGFGGKTKVVALLRDGSVVGESVMAGTATHGADVIAVEECRTLTVSRTDLDLLDKENPALSLLLLKRILKISSLRLQKSSERLALIL